MTVYRIIPIEKMDFNRRTNNLFLKSEPESGNRGNSSESYTIESPVTSTQTSQRSSESLTHYDKKIKLDKEVYSTRGSTEILDDTLENLNISNILKDSVSKPKKQLENENSNNIEFDAFASFLNDNIPTSNMHNMKNQNNEKNNTPEPAADDIFSQSFNTQMINEVEMAVNRDREDSKESLDNSTDNFKAPLLDSFTHRHTNIKARSNYLPCSQKIHNRSLIFTDKSITTQYKKEVDNIFEQIEHSICSTESKSFLNPIPDQILDVIIADEVIKDGNGEDLEEELHKSLASIDWEDKSFFNGANCSFGSIIKQALINNATKNIQPKKESPVLDCSLNKSLAEQVEFHNLGPFYGLPQKILDLIKQYKGIDKLYDWQEECLQLATAKRKNLIYALPTSGGKTLVAEILMLREVLCHKRNAIFILPYVAIVQEKVWDFSPFGVALDFLVEEYASSKGSYPPRKRRRKHSVYIATIEKALGLINSLIETGRLQEIGLIVIDELHLIGEKGRGATLEASLTKVMLLNANIQIVGMSATIGNIEEICKFLSAEVYSKNFRPVELQEYVKCGNEIAKINWSNKDEDDLLIDIKKIDYKYSEAVSKLDPDMLAGLSLEVIPKGSCLVFCPSKKNCENVVYLLCKLAKPDLKNYKKVEKEQLLNSLQQETGEVCETLKVSVPFGIAYHHSGLTNDERRLLEEAFRSGTISVICCTSTLAAGVNLPARRVILRSPYIGKDFISLSRYKQMAGRAGRAGLRETGESIIVAQPADMPKLKQLLIGPMNQALSSMHELEGRGLRHLLLSCISLGIANTRSLLQKVTRMTLMAVQKDKLNVNIKRLTDSAIKSLFKMGALQEGDDKGKESSVSSLVDVSVRMDTSLTSLTPSELDLSLSEPSTSKKGMKKTVVLSSSTKLVVSVLGTAAIKGGLELFRAHQLYDDLYDAQKSLVLLSCLHLLYLVTPYEISGQVRPNMAVYYDVLTHLGEKELQTAKVLGFDDAAIVKMATGQAAKHVPEKVMNRFYLTLMLHDLWNEMPVFKVSKKYQIDRGIVQNLMTSSATFASNVVNFCEQLEEFWAFSHLLKGMSQRLSHCCMKELLPLMELPAVKQSRAKQLYNAGYKNLQSLAKATLEDLVENIEFMPRKTAGQLIAAAKMLLLEKVENLREEAEDVLDGVENPRHLLNLTAIPIRKQD